MLDNLPKHLLERTRLVQMAEPSQEIASVIYWMRTAVRADENPALDVARLLAAEMDVPLLVYHAVSEHYRYASDRHHTFILQGAADVQRHYGQLDVEYAFHLATKADREKHLVALAEAAGMVVTEEMPVDPPRRFLNSLVRQTTATVITVDTACVAPMQLVGKAHTRAFAFRSATKNIYAQRLTRSWPTIEVQTKRFPTDELPFEPVDFGQARIGELVARCQIDHSVGPVVDTVGGSTAGYERWRNFRDSGLAGYAKKRNNALLNGVSRMSAYLHYGMVSPFRLAREAAQYDYPGAEKYLDELLIWRELAYSFCFFRDDHDQWSALPDWAQQTLLEHASDARQVYTWEQLARGQTNDELWNAAQQSLLKQGELHNNVRMTWGKAILNWACTPQAALQTIFDLNHRYALDGRDPASFGGILWCLGQFDRPFQPESPVFGTVRTRPTSVHAKRLSPAEFTQKVIKARFDFPKTVAIVGAGLSGLFAARTLFDHGLKVTVFEKSRGLGGRMSTRRTDEFDEFDHGAQYFTVRDRRFERYVHAWRQLGLVSRWPVPGNGQKIVVIRNGEVTSESGSQERFVGVPAMNSLAKHLAVGLEVVLENRIAHIEPTANGHQLSDEQNIRLGTFDSVIVSAPAEQTCELLAEYPDLKRRVEPIDMQPCWATLLSFAMPITHDWVGAFVHDSFLSWIARNSTKPGRDRQTENVILHANPEWTAANWDVKPEAVVDSMLEEFWRVTKAVHQSPSYAKAHRWRFALAKEPEKQECFFDPELLVGACGDWANGSRVEGAFLSGMAVAGRLLGRLTRQNGAY